MEGVITVSPEILIRLGSLVLRVCSFFADLAPVPVSPMVWGLPGAFEVTVSWPLAAPWALGEN